MKNLFTNLLRFFRRKPRTNPLPPPTLETVYVDAEARKWYCFENPLMMPTARKKVLEEKIKMLSFNITAEKDKERWRRMVDHANARREVELYAELNEGLVRSELLCERETHIEVCCAVFLVEGEPTDGFSSEWFMRKKRYLLDDLEAQAFFLELFLIKYRSYTKDSATAFLTYLTETEKINRFLNRNFSSQR